MTFALAWPSGVWVTWRRFVMRLWSSCTWEMTPIMRPPDCKRARAFMAASRVSESREPKPSSMKMESRPTAPL